MNRSKRIYDGKTDNTRSRLVKAVSVGLEDLESYEIKPDGVFGSRAKIICGGVTVDSTELDVEFNVRFDDDMEPNEAEIIIYNLSTNTINQFKYRSQISIEAGYEGDTGVIFQGYVTRVTTRHEGADKVTTIKCLDDISKRSLNEITYAAGTTASYILKDLLGRTGTPIAVFKMRRDWTYKDEEKVDGDLMENIKRYSEVCGVSTYINKGKIISRHISEGDNLYFDLNEETGLISSPEYFEEEKTAEDFKETIKGYECECLLQHRFAAGGIVNLKSVDASGTFRICEGEHRFSPDECVSKIKMY